MPASRVLCASGDTPLLSWREAREGQTWQDSLLPSAWTLDPDDALLRLRASGLRDSRQPCLPVYLAWAAQTAGSGLLMVDASEAFAGDQLPLHLLQNFSFALVEGLVTASALLGRTKAVLLVSPGREAMGLALEEWLANARGMDAAVPAISVEVRPHTREPERPPLAVNPGELRLSLETWCRLPLAFEAAEDFRQARCLFAGGAFKELPLGADLRELLGGKPGSEGALILDGGLGGFAAAGQPLRMDPELLRAQGLDPGLGSVDVFAPGQCPVDITRQALYAHWRLAAVRDGHPRRGLLARAARLATELALGRGDREQLTDLNLSASLLEEAGLAAAGTLATSLKAFANEWLEHTGGECPTGACRRRRVAPCQERCPAGIDIPNFLSLTGRGEHGAAVSIMVQDNPLPYACGLVCPAPCEKVCLRGKVDKPIHIRAMKAVSAKAAMAQSGGYPPVCSPRPASGRKVAVIGGGPAGLACASFLARLGHGAAIFEAMPALGGMMRYGIPEYRLPKAILDSEIATVTGLGVEVTTGKALGRDFTLDDLAAQGFDAAFLGLGAWSSRALGLEGEALLTGVVSGTQFLVELGLGRKPSVGERVIVVGGGNTAMDCARTAVRLGAKEVRVVYRRSRTEMPAAAEEVEEAEHEGVHFTFLAAPTRLVGEGGKLTGMEVVTMALGEPDASGRRRPEPKPGSERVIACDMIISAIGQFCDESFTKGADGTLGEVCLTKWRTIQINTATMATDRSGVFAGGDAAQGPATVVEAIRDGKRAAYAIDAHLRGAAFDPAQVEPRPRWERELLCSPHGCGWSEHARPEIPMVPVAGRSLNFDQVELGLDQAMAENEARRCLRCDVCIGCGLCQLVCSEAGGDALRFKEVEGRLVFEDFDRPTDKCVGCGACTRICPTGAMRLVLEKGETSISFTGHAISELPTPTCPECGKPLPAEQYLEQLRQRMGDKLASSAGLEQQLCPECSHKRRGMSFVQNMLR
ncbi:FAD-dependent oxidoreductase [Fundidesulfovibrio agrisoli]|uniref:FAD-dependent oxidoreductase n=1 Tax=Fundidesulfovibrio agrisoli TaxID=2922717 RepID=UPI001FAC25D2|nr:FAD-dependent oxidoreductase [Fundidesulfovibrio agrisoli]